MNYHFFYSERPPECSPLSNFWKTRYTIYGQSFPSSEHGFMYGKALLFGDTGIAKQILLVSRPAEAKALGRKVKGFSDEVWIKHREQIMFDNCYAKFSSNKKLRKYLLATGDKELVEASSRDRIWGIGYNRKTAPSVSREKWGSNLLGKVLMRVRHQLME